MKSSHKFGVTALLLILIAGTLILSVFYQPFTPDASSTASAMGAQVTATPEAEDHSVIGSTDGIVIMGILIVLIVVAPVLLRKKKK